MYFHFQKNGIGSSITGFKCSSQVETINPTLAFCKGTFLYQFQTKIEDNKRISNNNIIHKRCIFENGCSEQICKKVQFRRKLCKTHYEEFLRKSNCEMENCNRIEYKSRLCTKHYVESGVRCIFKEEDNDKYCPNRVFILKSSLCRKHYYIKRRLKFKDQKVANNDEKKSKIYSEILLE